MTTNALRRLDTSDLEARIKVMYEQVAREPVREFHFETGRAQAERLGYPTAGLDVVPPAPLSPSSASATSSTSPQSSRATWSWT